MCISNKPATFKNTKGYIGRTKNNTVVMAYQMDAQSIGESGMRAIILQIPAKKIVKIHDTTNYNKFLNEIYDSCEKWVFNEDGIQPKMVARSKSVEIKPTLEKIGMYNVIVLNCFEQFKHISKLFPSEMAPEITPELIEFYSAYYSDWKFVVATFDNKKQMSTQPFLIEYESLIYNGDNPDNFEEVFIFPSLDNGDKNGFHSGIPKIGTYHQEDHFLCFPHEKGVEINFSQEIPFNLISNRVGFYNKNEMSINGDFIVFANGQQIVKYDGEILGKIGLDNILKCKQPAQQRTNAFINW